MTVDDRVPVDLFGRPLLVGARPPQLWPLLLSKAVLKVMAAYRLLDAPLPGGRVAAFRMLTGFAQEDLAAPSSGAPAAGGALFDRLEDAVGWGDLLHPGFPLPAPAPAPLPGASAAAAASAAGAGRGGAVQGADEAAAAIAAVAAAAAAAGPAVVTCCLKRRSKPARNPPRIVVLCGPGAVGRGALARRLVAEHPDRFGATVSTTTRLPREHEVDGR